MKLPLQERPVVGEDLAGFRDDPDLIDESRQLRLLRCRPERERVLRTSESSSWMVGRGRYCTGFRLNSTCEEQLARRS